MRAALSTGFVLLACVLGMRETSDGAGSRMPSFTADGALRRPDDYRRWVFVGASLGLSYTDPGRDSGPKLFHHVYIDPSALAAFARTGLFPEGTMLALELYEPGEKAAPAKDGVFEARFVALEMAVKDHARFRGGWAYFGFGEDGRIARPAPDGCANCHRRHAANDNVFTQFYPVLRDARPH